jgi:nitrogen regulatory protein A
MMSMQEWLEETKVRCAADFMGIALNVAPDNQPKEIRWLYVAGNLNDSYKKIQLQLNRGVAGIVWKTARLQTDEMITEDSQKMIDYPIARLEKLQSVSAAPVLVEQQVQAVLLIGMRQAHLFSQVEQQRLLGAADQLAQYIKERLND